MLDVFPHSYLAIGQAGAVRTYVQKFPVIHILATDGGFGEV
jgi:hypothetical protein